MNLTFYKSLNFMNSIMSIIIKDYYWGENKDDQCIR
jgi:hypothetical protein